MAFFFLSDEPALAEVVDQRGVDELVLKTNIWWRFLSRNTCAFVRNCAGILNIDIMNFTPFKTVYLDNNLELSIKT